MALKISRGVRSLRAHAPGRRERPVGALADFDLPRGVSCPRVRPASMSDIQIRPAPPAPPSAPQPPAAIARLPVEILALVFEAVWHATAPHPRLDIEYWPWYCPVHPALVAISHVSRVWRQIALNLPILWSRVDDRMGDRMLAFLDRSREAPLFLSICLSIFHSGIPRPAIHDLLRKAAHRLRRLDVRLEAVDIFSHPRLDFVAPELEVLTIQCEIYSGVTVVNHPLLLCNQTASLRALALLHVRHWLPGNSFPNLIHLNISYIFMEELPICTLAHLLSNCPHLETLHLGQIWSYSLLSLDLTLPPAPVHLPRLRSLVTSCATLQTVAALLSTIVLTAPIRIRVHEAHVQSHTNIWDNFLPPLTFIAPLERLEIATDGSRLYLLAESDRSAIWIQAEFQGADRATVCQWLPGLPSTLDLSSIRTFHFSCADWSCLPVLVREMPALSVLGTMLPPDNDNQRDLIAALEHALLSPDMPHRCQALATLSVQGHPVPEHARALALLAVRRAALGTPLSHLIFARMPVLHPGDRHSPVDERVWESVRCELAPAQAHVQTLEAGSSARGVCQWEAPGGWDVANPYWRLPEGDEPRCAFPWHAA